MAGRYLRSKRKNGGVATVSIISFFCIMLAVGVLTVTMAVFNGFRTEMLDKMLSVNGHAFVKGEPLHDASRGPTVNRLRAVPGVVRVTPIVHSLVLVSAKGTSMAGEVRAISPADLRATPIIAGNIKAGSLNGFGEGEYGGNLILVGDLLARTVGLIPGDYITLTSPDGASTALGSAPVSKSYTVSGIYSVGMSQIDQTGIYMPLEQGQAFFNRGTDVDTIEVITRNPDELDRTMIGIRKAAGPGAVVEDWRDADNVLWSALQTERTMVRMILMMLVLIAAMTIISGVVMLVKNKERDIAILRTMGAGRGAMMRVFIIAGASIGILAAPAGVGLAVLFCHYIVQIQSFVEWVTHVQVFNQQVYFLPHLPAKIDWREVAWTCGLTMALSIIVTIFPSWRASRIDPVEALRYE